jgi:septum formation inhibitor-activating ATPase MinD
VRAENARQQRLVAVAEVLDVLHVEFMGLRVKELGIADCSCHGGPLVVRRTRRMPPAIVTEYDRDR